MSRFDAAAKDAELVADASSWDVSNPSPAEPGDIPVVDIGEWLDTGSPGALAEAADSLRVACERVGFFQLVGHGVDEHEIESIFEWARTFHALPQAVKERIHIDNPDHSLDGVGYMPIGERRLPAREVGNRNEAFLMKSDEFIDSDDNQWPGESVLPGFRAGVESYGRRVEGVALKLVRVYAVALGLDENWFEQAMASPFWRLRMTHYPPDEKVPGANGIAPHVDTTFFTLLLQDSAGLVVHSQLRGKWIQAPVIPGAFVVNTGELLRQWSNDRFLSTRHFADNHGSESRYSIPLFFNAARDWPMECLPTCQGPGNPPRYPTISYNQSQAIVQGE